MGVAGHQRHRAVGRDRVEVGLVGSTGGRPVAAAPAAAEQPTVLRCAIERVAHAGTASSSERLPSSRTSCCAIAQVGKCTCESGSRARHSGRRGRSAPARAARSRAPTRRPPRARRRSRALRASGSEGSIVRIDAVLEDHVDSDRTAAPLGLVRVRSWAPIQTVLARLLERGRRGRADRTLTAALPAAGIRPGRRPGSSESLKLRRASSRGYKQFEHLEAFPPPPYEPIQQLRYLKLVHPGETSLDMAKGEPRRVRLGWATVAEHAGVSVGSASQAFGRPEWCRKRCASLCRRRRSPSATPGRTRPRDVAPGTCGRARRHFRRAPAYQFTDPASPPFLRGHAAGSRRSHSARFRPGFPLPRRDGPDSAVRRPWTGSSSTRRPATIHAWRPARPPPTVVTVDQPRERATPFVGIDDRAAARTAAEYVRELGHKRVGVLTFVTAFTPQAGSGSL